MTAEVAIMNKQGIALAADSAGSIGSKIFNSNNKLFMLSKFHPVGIMIYSSAEIMGFPWETVIKMYRENLDEGSFPTINDYTNNFIEYIKTNNLFSNEVQNKFVINSVHNIVSQVNSEWSSIVKAIHGPKPKPQDQDNALNYILARKTRQITEKSIEGEQSDDEKNKFSEKHRSEMRSIVDSYFKDPKLSDEIFEKIYQLVYGSLFINPDLIGETGIVVAGFGTSEVFPAVNSFELSGVLNGKILKKETRQSSITADSRGQIIPFAQEQMVYSFVFGIDPRYDRFISRFFYDTTNKMPEILCNTLFKRKSKKKDELKALLEAQFKDARKEFQKKNHEHQMETYVDPIFEGVGYLPIDELASMAESLVNLTSFKKRVTANEKETVGGPIDVAVITKGDGFIWIRRKHYFKEEFNKHFFANYYRKGPK